VIEKILDRLQGVKRVGKRWVARCPAHDDKDPSLSLREADDGRVLLHCFAGCPAYDVVTAVGLELSDLFPEKLEGYRSKALDDALQHERTVLLLVKSAKDAGKQLDPHELNRAELALHRLRVCQ
jgi:DNA primase